MTEVKSFSYDDITVYYLDDGVPAERPTILKKIWHREDGPAIVSHYSYKILQEWFIWGKRTAGENIPTIVHLDQETKKVIKEEYLIDGSLHRTNGPAYLDIANGVGGFFVDDRDVTNNALKYCNHHGIDPLNMDEGDKALMHLGLEKWGY